MPSESLIRAREFLKDKVRQELAFSGTDQGRGRPPPPVQKPCPPDLRRIRLPQSGDWKHVRRVDLVRAMAARRSHRSYRAIPLKLDELSFLLWATQGIRQQLDEGTALRVVPSAGARHTFETYLCTLSTETLCPGIYRYRPLEHALVHVSTPGHLSARLREATLGQSFAGEAAAVIAWSTLPYRMEWRYGIASHKVIAIDVGHVCQNLYLACEAIGAGTCAIAAYDQDAMDRLLGIDGMDEFTIYLASVGKI